mmetsp:Transcript_25653/g.53728  ORF Transcript_25653/g.53728 Transcript_25653/m.53728 type:complete len:128 (+) Transcript_25653:129-512(+)
MRTGICPAVLRMSTSAQARGSQTKRNTATSERKSAQKSALEWRFLNVSATQQNMHEINCAHRDCRIQRVHAQICAILAIDELAVTQLQTRLLGVSAHGRNEAVPAATQSVPARISREDHKVRVGASH